MILSCLSIVLLFMSSCSFQVTRTARSQSAGGGTGFRLDVRATGPRMLAHVENGGPHD